MKLPEWNEQELLCRNRVLSLSEHKAGPRYVLLVTPFCGTCQAARRMLEIVAVMEPALRIGIADINLCRELTREWRIESVPCLVEVQSGRMLRKRYRMEGVPALREWMAAPSL
ncbi:thioredoxin family protein [Paenibacillus puerhi]|uniref:thioredoxin family protein n=1 Tax=Paenibacillus puerhi TaxID=2692622 RepID=UPI001F1AD931|nr:thioredoxin family protein [Paenibacillus puerhi]